MSATQPKTVRKRLLRILIIVLGIFIIASVALHIWFINNAKGALKQIISKESHGKLKLELSELSFSLFSNKMQIREADLSSVDSLNQPTTYRIKFRKLTVKVSSIWPLLFQKKLLLDSIKLHDPEIEVVQWRPDTSAVATND